MITTLPSGLVVEDLECPCNWDLPERPRDWNFDGPREALNTELEVDARETGCRRYSILETFDDGAGGLWSIWRNL